MQGLVKAGLGMLITIEEEYLYVVGAKDVRPVCCTAGQQVNVDQLSKIE